MPESLSDLIRPAYDSRPWLNPAHCRVGKRKRGNPDWSKPLQTLPALLTEFEMQVKQLGLTREQFVASAELTLWCKRNRNRLYVTEWLLEACGIEVEALFSGVKKTCVQIVHPDGRLIPFDTYNLFYRDGLEQTRQDPLRKNAEAGLAAV
jgi:hypothetical protein